MGYGEKVIGIFLMAAALTKIPSSILSGWLTDHIGRKKVILVCQSISACCFIPCAFLDNSTIIPFLIIVATSNILPDSERS